MIEKNKKFIKIIIPLLVLGVLSLVLFKYQKSKQPKNLETIVKQRYSLPEDKLPEGLPKDVPLEKDSKTLQNMEVELDFKKQGRRQYVSQKTIEENYTIYKNYLTQSGWQIISDLNEPELKSIIASQSGQTFSVSVGKNTISGEIVVNTAVEF